VTVISVAAQIEDTHLLELGVFVFFHRIDVSEKPKLQMRFGEDEISNTPRKQSKQLTTNAEYAGRWLYFDGLTNSRT
jgi:hypothetical protein